MTKPQYSPFKPGTRVRTTKRKGSAEDERRNWESGAIDARRWGITGIVGKHHDSHGLCYEVTHDSDKSIVCYDPEEIDEIKPTSGSNEQELDLEEIEDSIADRSESPSRYMMTAIDVLPALVKRVRDLEVEVKRLIKRHKHIEDALGRDVVAEAASAWIVGG